MIKAESVLIASITGLKWENILSGTATADTISTFVNTL